MPKKNAFLEKKATFEAVVQLTLTPDDAPHVVGYVTDEAHLFEMLEILVSTGYEVSVSRNEKYQNFTVLLKGMSPDCPNAGKWMYSNGDDLKLAYCAAFYKHFEISQQGEWKDQAPKSTMGFS